MRVKHALLLVVVIVTLSSFKDEQKKKTKVKPCTGLIIYVMTYEWNDSLVVGLELKDGKEIVIKTKTRGYTPMVNELYNFDCKLIPKIK